MLKKQKLSEERLQELLSTRELYFKKQQEKIFLASEQKKIYTGHYLI